MARAVTARSSILVRRPGMDFHRISLETPYHEAARMFTQRTASEWIEVKDVYDRRHTVRAADVAIISEAS